MKDFKKIEMYECSNCQRLHRGIPSAEVCCLCCYCGEPKGHKFGNLDCEKCREQKSRENFLKNLTVVDYDPNEVYCVDYHFFFDLDDIFQHLSELDSLDAWPEYASSTTVSGFAMDSEGLLESALEEHYEDACDALIDVDAFHEFINKWSEKQILKTYWEGSKSAIRISDLPGYEEFKAQYIGDHADD